MEDKQQISPSMVVDPNNSPPPPTRTSINEPVRSRWTPKPEQILILESIFNSGMVNPPKDETVRIRKLIEKFGAVGDANVFYWFQNRRSRSRRRQRQIQAATLVNDHHSSPTTHTFNPSSSSSSSASSSSCGGRRGIGEDGCFYSISNQQGLTEIQHHQQQPQQQPGFITVFINGVPSEVPNGSLDMRNMFGEDVMLVCSSGVPVPFNEYGFSLHSLQMGGSYFLVSRSI